jgi:hypothetical protein
MNSISILNDRNIWISGLVHWPVFSKLEDTAFRKMGLFPSSGDRGGVCGVPYKELACP